MAVTQNVDKTGLILKGFYLFFDLTKKRLTFYEINIKTYAH